VTVALDGIQLDQEYINRVEILETGELLLGLKSQGKPIYQFVYREAAGVYWDNNRHGFKSTPMKKWSCSRWFKQIVGVVPSALGVDLVLSPDVAWRNISEQQKKEIKSGGDI
jgi:hypothetical protein